MFFKKPLTLNSKPQNKLEKNTFKKWGTAILAGLCAFAVMSQKSVQAQDLSGFELIQQSRLNNPTELLSEDNVQFLQNEPTAEEKKSIEELRARLDNISSKRILSTPEIKSNAQINEATSNTISKSGIEVIQSDTDAYFLNQPENKYSDIVTENNTTQINIGVQKSVTTITNELPVTKGYQTTETFVVLPDEQGNYKSLFRHRSGYINADGTLNPQIPQTLGGQVNKPTVSNHAKDSIISPDVIKELQQPGRVSRDFFNNHGYVVQGKSFEQSSKLLTNIEKSTDEKKQVNVTTTIKHTHSDDTKSTIRESVRNFGYTSNSIPEANIGLNILAGAIPSPISNKLQSAKNQVTTSETTPKAEDKPAVIHSPEVLEELHLEQLSLRSRLIPSILESKLSALKDQKKRKFHWC